MEIILLERVEKLGAIGDVVTVKDGYARNFLFPNKKALRANAANRKVFEANRAKIEADNANRRGDAESHANNVEGKQIILIRAASNTGQLYGSVSVNDIVERPERARRQGCQGDDRARTSDQDSGRVRRSRHFAPRSFGDRLGQRRPFGR